MSYQFKRKKSVTTIKTLLNLKGRRALITGASGVLGRMMANTLAELGAELILVDLPGSELNGLVELIEEKWNVKSHYYYCNLEEQEQRIELLGSINNTFDELNILINNAAFIGASDLNGWSVPFEKQTVDTWRRAMEVNLTSVFELCKELTPLLNKSKGANIINIASIYGKYGPDWRLYDDTSMSNPAAYSASKGGLIQLTRWLATTIAPNIRVNAISPGGVFRNQPEQFIHRYESRTPLARMATEDDFRGAIAYLCSDMSSYVTGQNLEVDGGWGVW